MSEASSIPPSTAFWNHCLGCLEQELPAQQFKTWILPLRAEDLAEGDAAGLRLVAPSNFHRQWLRDRYLRRIEELGTHRSVLNPLWYAGAFGLGLVAGRDQRGVYRRRRSAVLPSGPACRREGRRGGDR